MIPLPFWVEKTEYREYTEHETELTPEQAMVAAKKKLREMSDEVLDDAELISKKIIVLPEKDGITLRCDMVCRTDIGKTVEFTVSDNK